MSTLASLATVAKAILAIIGLGSWWDRRQQRKRDKEAAKNEVLVENLEEALDIVEKGVKVRHAADTSDEALMKDPNNRLRKQ